MITTWKTSHDAICHSMRWGKATMVVPTVENLLQLEHESDSIVEDEGFFRFTSDLYGWTVIAIRREERGRPMEAEAQEWRKVAIRLASALMQIPRPHGPVIEAALEEYTKAIAKEHT